MKSIQWRWVFFLIIMLQPFSASGQSYVTWQGLEPDKLASLWLLKRFVDPQAEFTLVSRGSMISKGIPFDVPSAQFKRSHSQSTFESILKDQGINDEKLIYIGKIIHDIEINTWKTKKIKATPTVQSELREIIDQEQDEPKAIRKAMQFFDKIYQKNSIRVLQNDHKIK